MTATTVALWRRSASSSPEGGPRWTPCEPPVVEGQAERYRLRGFDLLLAGEGADRRFVLIEDSRGEGDLWVNGIRPPAGLAMLQHGDEILAAGQRYLVSTIGRPVVEIFEPAPGHRLPLCTVCRGRIEPGQQVVRCPWCQHVYHMIDPAEGRRARRCWVYYERCPCCKHPTAMTAETTWDPNQDLDLHD